MHRLFVDQPNLVDALEARGRRWTAYMEDLPAPCALDIVAGRYALKHNPFLYFQDIRTNAARCNHIVALSHLDADLASGRAPDFVWITPNLQHDTHESSVAEGDRWLSSFLPGPLASPAWRSGAFLIITWDEGTTNAAPTSLSR